MARPTLAESKDTRGDIAKIAMEMVQTRGFNAFSYQDVADRLGIRKASIHYHFASKEDLGLDMIERAVERARVWREKLAERSLTPVEKLEAFFDYFATVSANGTRLCPCGALVSEWNVLSPKLRSAVLNHSLSHREWLMKVMSDGRKSGEIRKAGTPEEQAQFIYASIHGGLLSSRLNEDFGIFRAVTRQILEAVRV